MKGRRGNEREGESGFAEIEVSSRKLAAMKSLISADHRAGGRKGNKEERGQKEFDG